MAYYKLIEITELPSDRNGSMSKFRRELLNAYNSNRLMEDKMVLLEDTLKFFITKLEEGRNDRLKTKEEIRRELAQKVINETMQPIKRAQRTQKKDNT